MIPVSADEMAAIQAEAVSAVCDKTCQIYRDLTPTTPDIYGSSSSSPSNTASYTLIATTVAGMSQPSAGELTNYAFEIEDKAAWTIHLPLGTDVTHRDHLVIEGQTLEVHVLLNPRSYEVFHSVIAAELK